MARSISLDQLSLPRASKSPALESLRKIAQSYLDDICARGGESVLRHLEDARVAFSRTLQEAAGLSELLRHFRQSMPAEQNINPMKVRLPDSAQQVLRAMQYECSFRGLTVLKIFPHDLPELNIPRDIMEMILFQLLIQARRAIGEQTGIITAEAQERVRLSPENTSRYILTLRISDTGPQISEAEFETLFDPLARHAASGGTSRGGFGLYAAKKMIEALGGGLRIETSDRGTSFYAEFHS